MSRIKVIFEKLRTLRTSGAVAPSSRFLTKRMTALLHKSNSKYVVELGGGNGVFTRKILSKMPEDGILLCFEINPVFCELLSRIKDPRFFLIKDSAEKMNEYMQSHNMPHADFVLSGLPLAIFPAPLTKNILNAVVKGLSKEGRYIQFQYSLNQLKELKTYFSKVTYGFTFINIPPAFVYTCKK